MTKTNSRVSEFADNCCDIELETEDLALLKIDNCNVLLELDPPRDSYGVFYSAKGRQWDIWCHPGDVDNLGGVTFAAREPLKAARQLLMRNWRADFEFDPSEDD